MKLKKHINRIMTAIVLVHASALPVFADTEAFGKLSNLNNLLINIIASLGIPVTIWGVSKLALAIKNQDAQSQEQALLFIISGLILLSTQPIVNMLIK